MSPVLLVAGVVVMLAALAALRLAPKVRARLARPLPWCMANDTYSSWGDHQAGQCLCPANIEKRSKA